MPNIYLLGTRWQTIQEGWPEGEGFVDGWPRLGMACQPKIYFLPSTRSGRRSLNDPSAPDGCANVVLFPVDSSGEWEDEKRAILAVFPGYTICEHIIADH